jgi:hypothetical protein
MAKSLGLYYNLDITSDEELVCKMKQKMFIDKDMYDKILFNLCKCQQLINLYVIHFPNSSLLLILLGSNAFKYTFRGGVTVRLFSEKKEEREGVVLEVSDTGTIVLYLSILSSL